MSFLFLVNALLYFGVLNAHLVTQQKANVLKLSKKSMTLRVRTPVYNKYLEKYVTAKKQSLQKNHNVLDLHSVPETTLQPKFSLENILAGDKYNGNIVSIRGNGFFVDIGAKKDGFVHIKDASEKYFVDNLWSRFSIGQNLTVFVKYVDAKNKSLALQLHPNRKDEMEQNSLNWTHISPGMSFDGRVVKSSNYGVYVDIGAPVLGFLHRRKMLSNRRQRNLKPWEVCPLGSTHQCFIYNVNAERHRIELTTYPPAKWESIFGMFSTLPPSDQILMSTEEQPNQREKEDVDSSVLIDDVDYDDDVNDVNDDDDDDNNNKYEVVIKQSVQNLRANEIQQIVEQRSSAKRASMENSDYDELESTSMMFREVSEGRSRISFRDLLGWDMLNVILRQHNISRDNLKKLFLRSGTVSGQLDEDGFERLVHLLDHEIDEISGNSLTRSSD